MLRAGGEGAMAWIQIQSNLQTAEVQGKFGLQHKRGCQLKMYHAKSTHSSKARATTHNLGIRLDGKVSQQKEKAI